MTNITPSGVGEAFDQLKDLLREMFQLDRGDLDFGLYRIMNMKAGEIEAFLDRDLLPQVKTVLAGVSEEGRTAREQALAEARESARTLGVNPDTAPKVIELQEQLAAAKSDANAEADVYGHLVNFFARYYREGDFMSLRRYTSGGQTTYLIPYDGEEVKLHWANADQYYVKTTENYAAYAFTVGEGENARRVRFEIAAADNEKDNNKEVNGKQRRFVPAQCSSPSVAHDGSDLVVHFKHKPLTDAEKKMWPGNGTRQQDQINEASSACILDTLESDWRSALAAPAPTEANPKRTLLEKHIGRYTAKNSFDYFIHKDLSGFLHRELDLYLKTDVLNLDDLAVGDEDRLSRALARMRAVRQVGEKIIAFLAQLEDFQKHLWLKKKFVLETQWCVTLDRVPEALYPEIAANEAQREEWVALFAIDDISGDFGNSGTGYSEPLTSDFLKANPYLVLDTRHFGGDFRDRLLEALSDAGPLDERTDGLLIHGENFQALNLLLARYGGQVKCIYIDPPYNSKTSEILYKNNYKHSSWLSLMDNRITISRKLSTADGSHIIAIDENEQIFIGQLLKHKFPNYNNVCVSIVHNKKGIQGDHLSYNHDFAYFCIPQDMPTIHGKPISKEDWKYIPLRKWGRESERSTAKNCFYPIFVDNDEIVEFGEVCSDDFHPGQSNVIEVNSGRIVVYPVDPQGIERKWRYARGSVESIRHLLKSHLTRAGEIQIHKASDESAFKTVWDDSRYIAGDYGTKWLTDLGLKLREDLYPKSIHTVMDSIYLSSDDDSLTLDYFAGSGTTGHAVINLNREDGGRRKYVLVEMGDHFVTVMLPRLKKVAYAADWKDGKPVARGKGVTQLIKYVRLESYEDTLDGLVLTPADGDLLAGNNPSLAEDYRLRYALGAETADSPCLLGRDFVDPFAYTLSIVRDGARCETLVDLPETFNYLLGLRVASRHNLNGVLTIAGANAQGQNCIVLWRNLETMDNDALERWCAEHRARFPDPLDLVYANGDHTLNAIRRPGEVWTAETIEPLFRELMFEADNP